MFKFFKNTLVLSFILSTISIITLYLLILFNLRIEQVYIFGKSFKVEIYPDITPRESVIFFICFYLFMFLYPMVAWKKEDRGKYYGVIFAFYYVFYLAFASEFTDDFFRRNILDIYYLFCWVMLTICYLVGLKIWLGEEFTRKPKIVKVNGKEYIKNFNIIMLAMLLVINAIAVIGGITR